MRGICDQENTVKKFINLRGAIGFLLVTAGIAFVAHRAFALNFWITYAITVAAILLVGLSALFVDE
jgi:hypothetical protein